jgi:hypothetical protein
MRCASIKTLIVHTLINTFSLIMSKSIALSLLAQGNTGEQILQILDTLVADIQQENINDFVEYAVALNTPTLEEVAF